MPTYITLRANNFVRGQIVEFQRAIAAWDVNILEESISTEGSTLQLSLDANNWGQTRYVKSAAETCFQDDFVSIETTLLVPDYKH